MKLLMENWRGFLNEDVEVEPIPINQLLYISARTDGASHATAQAFLRDNIVKTSPNDSPDEEDWWWIRSGYMPGHPPAVYGYIKFENEPSLEIKPRGWYKAVGRNMPEHSKAYKSAHLKARELMKLANLGGSKYAGMFIEEGWRRFLNEFTQDLVKQTNKTKEEK